MFLDNRTHKEATVLVWLSRSVLLAGIAVRIVVYAQNRSLFLDEANLALNIAERSWLGFFSPLSYDQYAPPLFMILEKTGWLLIGAGEAALRFWPLVMGCVSLWLIDCLLRHHATAGWPGIFVLWLFAFSPFFIRYATEVKQYSTDMAVSALLVWLCLRWPPREHSRRLLLWLAMGSIAIWMSMPSVFILAGVIAYTLYEYYGRSELRAGMRVAAVTGIFWSLQWLLYYLLILRTDLQQESLISYHQSYFWPLLPTNVEMWEQAVRLLLSLLHTLSGFTIWAMLLGGLGILAGIYRLRYRSVAQLLLYGVPVILCLAASGMGYYSMIPRLTLFMMPVLGILLFHGLHWVWSCSPRWVRFVLLVSFLPVLFTRDGYQYIARKLEYSEMRPLLEKVSLDIEPQDYIWVEHSARPAFTFYTQWHKDRPAWPQNQPVLYGSWRQLAGEDVQSIRPQRLWLIFSHLVSDAGTENMQRHERSVKDLYGPALIRLQQPGAKASLYELEGTRIPEN